MTIGHNNGPSLTGGTGWQRHCWTRARRDLLPTLPIEVVRLRVKRAAEIGLDYRTYASIRATSGHDVIALLFSTNALRLLERGQPLPVDRQTALSKITGAERGALVQAPLTQRDVQAVIAPLIDTMGDAPRPFASWSEARQGVQTLLRRANWPADRVVMIGDTLLEAEWAQAARLAWYLPADRYFAA